MARHIPTGQLVAVKQTNLDECTEEELLQLMASVHLKQTSPPLFRTRRICVRLQIPVCLNVSLCLEPPERGSAVQAVSSPQPADLSPGVQLLLPAVGPHTAHGLRSAADTPQSLITRKLHCAVYVDGPFPSCFACRLGRHLTKDIFPRWNE